MKGNKKYFFRATLCVLLIALLSITMLCLTACDDVIVFEGIVVQKIKEKTYLIELGAVKLRDPRDISGCKVLVKDSKGQTQWFFATETYFATLLVGGPFVYDLAGFTPIS